MTVGELVKLLLEQDQDLEVRISTECCHESIDGVDLQHSWGKRQESDYVVIE